MSNSFPLVPEHPLPRLTFSPLAIQLSERTAIVPPSPTLRDSAVGRMSKIF